MPFALSSPRLLAALLFSVLVPSGAAMGQSSYFFTRIVAEGADYSSFNYPYSINDNGVVAFTARVASQGHKRCILAGNGNTPTIIATPSATPTNSVSRFADYPSINNSGVVAFYLYTGSTPGPGTVSISTSSGAAVTTIADSSEFYSFGRPVINNGGRTAFLASRFSNNPGAVYMSNGNDPLIVLAEAKADRSLFFDGIINPISFNDNNAAAFYAQYNDTGFENDYGIFRTDGTTPVHIAGNANGFSNVSIEVGLNNNGVVAFLGEKTGTGEGVFTGSGGAVTTIADTSGPFDEFYYATINNSGDVIFFATLDAGGGGLYLSSGGNITRVIGSGDALAGSTVTGLNFYKEGFNDNGQVAFYANLSSGPPGIFRATLGSEAPASFNANGHPTPRIAALGGTTTFTSSVAGLPDPSYQWRKGTTAIKGQVGSTYTLNNVQLSNAGSYNLVIKNSLTPPAGVTSTAAELGVVDTSARTVNAISGKNLSLTVSCSTNITGFQWHRNGQPLADVTGHIAGSTKKTLTITKLTNGSAEPLVESDAGDYHCVVTLPTATLGPIIASGGTTTVRVINAAPDITDTFTLPEAMVGDPYNVDIAYDMAQNRQPTAWSVKPALPAGLKLNTATGNISGIPTGALTADTTYNLTFRASNAVSAASFDTLTVPLIVRRIPVGAVGVFVGYMNRNSSVNDSLGGRLDLTTMTNGTFSGKLTNGTAAHSFTGGKLVSDVTGVIPLTGSISIRRTAPLPNLLLTFTFDPLNDRLGSVVLTNGLSNNMGEAWRNVPPAANHQGLHNLGLPLTSANAARPQGTSFGSYTVAATGKLTAACTLADGVSFTTAGHISRTGEVLFFFNSTTTDSVLAKVIQVPGVAADFSDDTYGGFFTWARRVQPASSHTYAPGFAITNLTPTGGRYRIPLTTEVALGLPYSAVPPITTVNGRVTFTLGDFGATAIAPNADLLIKPGGKSSVIPDANASRTTTFSIVPGTGAFKGRITLVDNNPLTSKPVTRAVDYKGLIYTAPTGLTAAGFYLLPKVPATTGQTLKNTEVQSGKVVLGPLP